MFYKMEIHVSIFWKNAFDVILIRFNQAKYLFRMADDVDKIFIS